MKRMMLVQLMLFGLGNWNGMAQDQKSTKWRGLMEINQQTMRVEVVIDEHQDVLKGAFYINGKGPATLTDIVLSEGEFQFSIAKVGASFVGNLSENGTLATGTLSEDDQSAPLKLRAIKEEMGEVRESWAGELKINDMALAMQVRILEGETGQTTTIFDSLDEKESYEANWSIEGDALKVEVPFIQLVFRGDLNPSRNMAAGTWIQPGRELPFTLKKRSKPMGQNLESLSEKPLARLGEKKPTPRPQHGFSSQNQSIPAAALGRLSRLVQSMVDKQEIVGGELLVIKNKETVLRQAFGWKDRESKQPMVADAVYCIRSMTKPLVGTAIQMLIDEGRLQLDTPVHQILPFFKGPETGKITVAHLLTHSAGYPFTTITKPLADYGDIFDVAAEVAGSKRLFEPGTDFEYSDGGSDTLGAVVAKVSGMPVAEFVQKRILDPLGMKDAYTLLAGREEVLARVPSAYSGGTGSWSKHWEPSDGPLFPIFLTSQSLYATTTDYARFLALWMDNGKVGDQRLLSPEAVVRGLAPNHHMKNYPANYGDLNTYYGQQWIVYAQPNGHTPPKRVLFGHDGSDGTFAWAWPEQDLMVLFFTQSRGTLAGLNLGQSLSTLFDEQIAEKASPKTNRHEMEQLAGLYWDETAVNAYYVVTPLDTRLRIERPGRMYEVFKPGKESGRFVHEANAKVWVEFLRNQDGVVTGMRTAFGGKIEHDPKHVPQVGLPSPEEVIAKVAQAHRLDRLSNLGVVRLTGHIKFETRGMEGPIKILFDTKRERAEVRIGSERETSIKHEGQAWTSGSSTGTDMLSGMRLEQALLDRTTVRFGDWLKHYQHVEVLKRLQIQGKSVLLVRVVPREAPGSTMYVEEASGLVRHVDSIVQIPGIGTIGLQTTYADFRDVGGMHLPFQASAKFSSKILGRVVTKIHKSKTHVKVSKKTFAAPKRASK